MRRFYYLSAAVMFAVILLAACNSKEKTAGTGSGSGVITKTAPTATTTTASSTPNVPGDGVRRITWVELRDMLDKGTAVVIDTRPLESYKVSHIKGSINMPVDEVAGRVNDLPRDKMIVAYCS